MTAEMWKMKKLDIKKLKAAFDAWAGMDQEKIDLARRRYKELFPESSTSTPFEIWIESGPAGDLEQLVRSLGIAIPQGGK